MGTVPHSQLPEWLAEDPVSGDIESTVPKTREEYPPSTPSLPREEISSLDNKLTVTTLGVEEKMDDVLQTSVGEREGLDKIPATPDTPVTTLFANDLEEKLITEITTAHDRTY